MDHLGTRRLAFLALALTACGSGMPARSSATLSTTTPLAASSATAAPATSAAPVTPAPSGVSTATTWALACGTVSDVVKPTFAATGSAVLDSPGRSPLKIALTAARTAEGLLVGYVCVTLDAGAPYPVFAGLGMPGTEGYIAEGTYPATLAKPAPTGFVVPQTCSYVAPPEVGGDQTSWKVDCGAGANRDARGTLGAPLRQQGWTGCGPALATETFVRGTLRIVVVESSLAPGDYPRLSQLARPAAGCG